MHLFSHDGTFWTSEIMSFLALRKKEMSVYVAIGLGLGSLSLVPLCIFDSESLSYQGIWYVLINTAGNSSFYPLEVASLNLEFLIWGFRLCKLLIFVLPSGGP